MAQEHRLKFLCNSSESLYFTNYIKPNAQYCLDIPTEEELKVIASGIRIAPNLTQVESIDAAMNYGSGGISEWGGLVNISDSRLPLSCFKSDSSIQVTENIFAAHGMQIQASQPWKFVTNYINNLNSTIRTFIDTRVQELTTILLIALGHHGYFQNRNVLELFAEIKLRQTQYPNQPIYVIADNETYRYLSTRMQTEWKQLLSQRVYIIPHNRNQGIGYLGVDLNKILGIDPTAYSTVSAGLSAVVAAGQVRINATFQDVIQVTPANINYNLRADMGIRIAAPTIPEDPNDRWDNYLGLGRLSLIDLED